MSPFHFLLCGQSSIKILLFVKVEDNFARVRIICINAESQISQLICRVFLMPWGKKKLDQLAYFNLSENYSAI